MVGVDLNNFGVSKYLLGGLLLTLQVHTELKIREEFQR